MNDTSALNQVRHLVVNMRKEPFDVYIGRNGRGFSACFGNSFPIIDGNPNATRQAVVAKLESLLLHGQDDQAIAMRASLHRLAGKKLGCFCSPNLCHGHPLAHHANSLAPGEILPLGGKVSRLTAPWVEIGLATQATAVTPAVAALNSSPATDFFVGFSRYPRPGQLHLELSSQGDKRFSALYARMKDGQSIETIYQLDVKGYRAHGNDWRLGKGKPPLKHVDLWASYKALWARWLDENPDAFADLAAKAQNRTLTDKFASSPISQARALAELLSERLGWRLEAGGRPVAAPPAVKASATEQSSGLAASAKETAPPPQGDLFGEAVDPTPSRTRMRP